MPTLRDGLARLGGLRAEAAGVFERQMASAVRPLGRRVRIRAGGAWAKPAGILLSKIESARRDGACRCEKPSAWHPSHAPAGRGCSRPVSGGGVTSHKADGACGPTDGRMYSI